MRIHGCWILNHEYYISSTAFGEGIIMPKFGVRVPHTLTKDEARSRLERFIDMLTAKSGNQVSDLQQSWEGDTLKFGFKTYGIAISGGITVGENELDLAGDLPFAAMMFKGKIESEIREQLEKIVAAPA
jgi:putative polyhydroxyalkanoate system protein